MNWIISLHTQQLLPRWKKTGKQWTLRKKTSLFLKYTIQANSMGTHNALSNILLHIVCESSAA